MWVWRGMGHRLSHHVKEPLVKSKKDRQLVLSQVHEDKEVEVCCSVFVSTGTVPCKVALHPTP